MKDKKNNSLVMINHNYVNMSFLVLYSDFITNFFLSTLLSELFGVTLIDNEKIVLRGSFGIVMQFK